AERERTPPLLLLRIDDGDPRAGQQPEVLDRELAEAAGADHERRLPRAERVAHPADHAVRRHARVRERRRADRAEPVERKQVAPRRDEHELRIAAVAQPTRLGRARAELLVATAAEAARAATPGGGDEDVPTVGLAGDLVPEHERQRQLRVPTVCNVQVAPANARAADADDHLVAARRRLRTLLQPERRPERTQDSGSHGPTLAKRARVGHLLAML